MVVAVYDGGATARTEQWQKYWLHGTSEDLRWDTTNSVINWAKKLCIGAVRTPVAPHAEWQRAKTDVWRHRVKRWTGGGARSCNLKPDLAHTYMHKVVQYEAGNRGSRKEMGTSPSH